jgi:CRP-like cAMP-binding protein
MDRPKVTGPQLVGELMQSLSRSALFEGINDKHLQRLMGIGFEEQFKKGEYIFREDDPGDKFYLVLEGAVRITRQVPGMGEEALAILESGAAFGEMALIEDFPRSADAIVHQDCRLFVVRKEDLEDLLFLDRDLAYEVLWKMVRVLSARLRETTNKMAFLTFAGKFE